MAAFHLVQGDDVRAMAEAAGARVDAPQVVAASGDEADGAESGHVHSLGWEKSYARGLRSSLR
jgi:hypothetical protein